MAPENPVELELVYKAIRESKKVSGCFEWQEKAANIFRQQGPALGLRPQAVKRLIIAHVEAGGQLTQVKEKREQHADRFEFYYKVSVPWPELPRGLFVEIVLLNDDAALPVASIVSCHA